jgi:hypothetical protein
MNRSTRQALARPTETQPDKTRREMQDIPLINIDMVLVHLRWRAADFEQETLLRYIAQYRDYYVVTQRGRLAPAPDDKNRFLIAVFTSAVACNEFLTDGDIEADAVEIEKIDGRTLFPKIAAANPDGVVFNCRGPQNSIAFVPRMIALVLEHMDDSHSDAPPSRAEQIDFDTMAANAFPKQQPGERADIDLLMRAAFSLDEWFVVALPGAEPTVRDAPVRPFTLPDNERYNSAYVFTDARRGERFVSINQLKGENGQPLRVVSVPADTLVGWSQAGELPLRIRRLHFNFGNPGWFSPMENIPAIFEQLKKQSQ